MTALHWPGHQLTLADWEAMPETEGYRTEVVEGALLVAAQPFLRHQWVCGEIRDILKAALGPELIVIPEPEVLLATDPLTIRVPDVAVARREVLASNPRRLEARDALLAVEVLSPSTRRTDRVMKLAEYADAGIGEYWIVDPDEQMLTVHTDPAGGHYNRQASHRGRVRLSTLGRSVGFDFDQL